MTSESAATEPACSLGDDVDMFDFSIYFFNPQPEPPAVSNDFAVNPTRPEPVALLLPAVQA